MNQVPLNFVFLRNRILELGIKQWWLAEQLGVDRKTVVRWMNGHVKSLQKENADKLAKILACRTQDFTAGDADTFERLLATPAEQKAATAIVAKGSLIDKLGPIGEWNVIEALLKASFVPDLPLNILGELYDQLAIASWRQSEMEQAVLYTAKAQEIALKTGDQVLLASVLLSSANLQSWKGDIPLALSTYRECLALANFIDPRVLGTAYSNLGAVLYESGDFVEGELYIRRAIEQFDSSGTSTNLSVAHCHLAMIYLQRNLIAKAANEVLVSLHCADRDDYKRGKEMGKLIQAEIVARRGRHEEARTLLTEALEGVAKLGLNEALNFEFAARVCRLIDDLEQAETYLHRGLQLAKTFPVYEAALYVELAEIQRARSASWRESADRALELYRAAGCPLRVDLVQMRFEIQ